MKLQEKDEEVGLFLFSRNISAKVMKIFHECWIFHSHFVTIERGYMIAPKGKAGFMAFLDSVFFLERNFERKMKRYHCTNVQSVVS
jgi:hypothetical protein